MDTSIPDTWTVNAGSNKRELAKGMLVRLSGPTGWKPKIYAVARVSGGSAVLVPTQEGGWSSGSSGAENVSVNSEVQYRRDEGAPYNSERYGTGVGVWATASTAPKPPKSGEPLHPSARPVAVVPRVRVIAEVLGKEVTEEFYDTEALESKAETKEVARVAPDLTKVSGPPVKVATKKRAEKVAAPAVEPAPVEAEAVVETKNQDQGGGKIMRTGVTKKASVKKPTTKVAKVPKPKKVRTAPVEESDSGYPYTLAQVAEKAGVLPSRVNALRRAGLLPKRGGFTNRGRAVVYSEKALAAIVKAKEKGVRIPAPTAGSYVAEKGGTLASAQANQRKSVASLGARVGGRGAKRGPGRPRKAQAQQAASNGSPLSQQAAALREKAQRYLQLADQIEALAAEL